DTAVHRAHLGVAGPRQESREQGAEEHGDERSDQYPDSGPDPDPPQVAGIIGIDHGEPEADAEDMQKHPEPDRERGAGEHGAPAHLRLTTVDDGLSADRFHASQGMHGERHATSAEYL